MNKIIIIGRLGKDPELRHGANGNAVSAVSVATSDKFKDKETGELKERTDWHRVVFFGRQAEVAAEYLRKGSQVAVEGRSSTREYEKDGVTHRITEVICNNFEMLGSRPDAQDTRPSKPVVTGYNKPAAKPATKVVPGPTEQPEFDDDIPF